MPPQSQPPTYSQTASELDLRVIHEARHQFVADARPGGLLDLAIAAEFVVDWQIEESDVVART